MLITQRWIHSRRTFSNNSYVDRRFNNYGPLCAINDDTLFPGYTIPEHSHAGLDILGYMLEGELEHWDSRGNISRVGPLQVQHMSTGPGISHTEKCTSTVLAKYVQIWIKQ